jgi:hypothetical protein
MVRKFGEIAFTPSDIIMMIFKQRALPLAAKL